MQVKKFEARSMKEALEMVKIQLGPDAIILGVKDNKRSFGLVGDGSIEITAAVSDGTLQRKKFTESRLRDQDKQKLANSSAKVQKEFINKMVDNYNREKQPQERPRPVTRPQYIDIADEHDGMALSQISPAERIRGAAQRAWNAMQVHGEWVDPTAVPVAPTPPTDATVGTATKSEISALKGEIATLRQVIKQFQEVPQNIEKFRNITSHPGADFGLPFEVSAMFEKLIQAGISSDIAVDILTHAQKQMPVLKLKSKAFVDAWVAKYLLDTTRVVGDKAQAKIQVFVGPAGAGKTSSLIKMASHLVVNDHKKIALLTADTLKVGAAEQMRIYAQILNVPFGVIRSGADWAGIIAQLGQFDHILVDAPGLTLKTMEENSLLRGLMPPSSSNATIHLVLEATAKDSDITEIGKRYKGNGFNDVIFTNLDLSNQHGTIYNFMRRFETVLHSFGIGTRVPEDYEIATKERVLDLIFKLTNLAVNRNRA
jgi:flagellar biosynthesis protein FlhF